MANSPLESRVSNPGMDTYQANRISIAIPTATSPSRNTRHKQAPGTGSTSRTEPPTPRESPSTRPPRRADPRSPSASFARTGSLPQSRGARKEESHFGGPPTVGSALVRMAVNCRLAQKYRLKRNESNHLHSSGNTELPGLHLAPLAMVTARPLPTISSVM